MLGQVYYGWWIVLSCFLMNLYVGRIFFSASPPFSIPFRENSTVVRGAILREYFGKASFGQLLGIVLGSASIGGILGPTLAGYAFDRLGGYALLWQFMSAACIVAVGLTLGIKRPRSLGTLPWTIPATFCDIFRWELGKNTLFQPRKEETMIEDAYEVIILGAGPAGLQAAIHAVRSSVSVLVLGKQHRSSLYRTHIENFCCLSRLDGQSLLKDGQKQAESFGAQFLEEDAVEVSKENQAFLVKAESGRQFRCMALIFALGIFRNKLNVPGEKELLGRGLSYCVDCDANFFRDEPVAVVGSGSAALTGALTLLFYTKDVHLILNDIEEGGVLARRIKESPVHLHEGRKIIEIVGKSALEGVLLDDSTLLDVKGLFIELGAKGAVELAGKLGVALDPESMKYIDANKKQETNIPGIYAAGDICGPPWQVAIAVGQGAVAGLEAAFYAKKHRQNDAPFLL
jgi:thioredoxin reductase (NADPH)